MKGASSRKQTTITTQTIIPVDPRVPDHFRTILTTITVVGSITEQRGHRIHKTIPMNWEPEPPIWLLMMDLKSSHMSWPPVLVFGKTSSHLFRTQDLPRRFRLWTGLTGSLTEEDSMVVPGTQWWLRGVCLINNNSRPLRCTESDHPHRLSTLKTKTSQQWL